MSDALTLEFRGGNRDIITARDLDVMIVGPAGTGKTVACVWKCHFAAMKYPESRILMARQTQEAIKSGALATYMNLVKPLDYGVTTFGGNKFSPAEFQYPNGSRIMVVGMDKPDKVLSTEFDLIYVNEVAEMREEAWETLRGRLRNGKVPYQMIFGDLNPSGIRHWANLRIKSGKTRGIQSKHQDNPSLWDAVREDWTAMGDEYVNKNLAGMTGLRRKRFFEGLWASAEGVVYDHFDPSIHVREVDTTGWRVAMGVDVGTKNPTCVLTVYQDPKSEAVHVGREYYRSGMSSAKILHAIRSEADRCDPDFIAIDPSAIAYILDLQSGDREEGWRPLPAYPADNDILVGIQRVKTLIEAETEPPEEFLNEEDEAFWAPEPLFSVDPSCENLIEEFGMYAFAPNAKIETDKPVKEDDHSMDALRYVASRLVLPRVEVGFF
jgi:phage terminase large subunit